MFVFWHLSCCTFSWDNGWRHEEFKRSAVDEIVVILPAAVWFCASVAGGAIRSQSGRARQQVGAPEISPPTGDAAGELKDRDTYQLHSVIYCAVV